MLLYRGGEKVVVEGMGVWVERRECRKISWKKKQLGDGEAKGKKKSILDNFKQACHNSAKRLELSVSPCCYAWAHTDMDTHPHAPLHTQTHTRQSVWVYVTVGSVCIPQAATPWKPSQNALIKTSPTITAHLDALTFTPPMNIVSYHVSLPHSIFSRSLSSHTLCCCEVRIFVCEKHQVLTIILFLNFKSYSGQHDFPVLNEVERRIRESLCLGEGLFEVLEQHGGLNMYLCLCSFANFCWTKVISLSGMLLGHCCYDEAKYEW